MVRRLRAVALYVVAVTMCVLVVLLLGCAWLGRVLHDEDD